MHTPALPRDDLRFSNTTGILKKKNHVVYWCKVEQETSAPPAKKNPGSAPGLVLPSFENIHLLNSHLYFLAIKLKFTVFKKLVDT